MEYHKGYLHCGDVCMSLEPGGRSDKYGNEYENQYLARLLLNVVNGKVSSVIVEPLDELCDSVEYITESSDGSIDYYQCKSSNGQNKSWTIRNLRNNKTISRIKDLLFRDPYAKYHFISPLPANEMHDLCERARTCNSPEEYVSFSLTNRQLRTAFYECKSEFDSTDDEQLNISTIISMLSRCFFEQIPFTEFTTRELEERLGLTFTGDAASIRLLLEHYINGNGKYGVKITAKDIINFLALDDHQLRSGFHDDRGINRINVLNNDYWFKSPGINGELLHRTASDEAIQAINNSNSVIMYGKAGAGKSSCLQEVIDYLNTQGILYLSIKLDKFTPNHSADTFGKEIGLCQSPVYELTSIASGKPCVLILDQLDALRWTNSHSSTALEVCKEIISQTATVNRYQNGKLSIIVALRKFDLDYDAGLQRLFEEKETTELRWRKICVDIFDEDEVAKIIGSSYSGFSSRLKRLLRTPSSLFIWSRLSQDIQKSNIVSVKQLMDIWWKQIQASCKLAGIEQSELLNCKNKMVRYMENRSTTVLNARLFSDYSKTIDFLMSSGMLQSSSVGVSFAHQSIFDYFITIKTLDAIYSGRDIIDFIESYDNQTPNVRYRLLVVLNDLIEADQDTFVNQARKLLQSDAVHFYFKCCVFETIGQCDNPGEKVLALLDDYQELSEWRDYIVQVVYFRHPVYVRHLTMTSHNWLDDAKRSMLKSIADIDPALVMTILQPYIGNTAEDDGKVYFALPYDITNDTEEVFSFRLGLLNSHPEFINSFIGLYGLINKQSERALDLLAIVLKNSQNQQLSQVLLEDDSSLIKYAHLHYSSIVDKLFPIISKMTKDYLPTWSKHNYYPDYEEWISNGLRESSIRRIVDLTKYAMSELARVSSTDYCITIDRIQYPFSGIGHELIMASIKELPLDYSDYCISWLIRDFPYKAFVFSSNQSDFLECTKDIIKKYSPHCSLPLFRDLEKKICSWKDDRSLMLNVLKYKLDAIRNDGRFLDLVFWGHFQKDILPYMAHDRLSHSAQELIQVLNRNEQIRLPYYCSGFSIGTFGPVVSPINNHTDKLSNKSWLKIINTPTSRMKDHHYSNKNGADYIESSHEMFASALGKQAKQEPVRFAKLSLEFPQECHLDYVLNVLYALANTENNDCLVPVDLLCQVIRTYQHNESNTVAKAITLIIHAHADLDWPDDILSLLEFYAVSHPNPGPNTYSITIGDDFEHLSPDTLLNNAINCVRGNALRAIGRLVWIHHELGDRFKQTVATACHDCNDAVRFSVMFCAIPYSNIDRHFSESVFRELVSTDLRVLTAKYSWELLSEIYKTDPKWCHETVVEALKSDIEGLANHAATLLCALAIFENDESMMGTLLEFPFSEKQFEAICLQAIVPFSDAKYHERSESIIRYLIKTSSAPLHSLGQLFYRRQIQIDRDLQFLTYLMETSQGQPLLHAFLDYLKKSDSDLRGFAEVFQAIVKGIEAGDDNQQRVFIMNDFIGCVIRLFDMGKEDQRIKTICLELWDMLFMKNLHGMRQISEMIDEIG